MKIKLKVAFELLFIKKTKRHYNFNVEILLLISQYALKSFKLGTRYIEIEIEILERSKSR